VQAIERGGHILVGGDRHPAIIAEHWLSSRNDATHGRVGLRKYLELLEEVTSRLRLCVFQRDVRQKDGTPVPVFNDDGSAGSHQTG
jgi:hypothetical protein